MYSIFKYEYCILSFFFHRTKGKYGEGDKSEKFTFTLSLVFVQCIINAIYARLGELPNSQVNIFEHV